MRAMSEQEGQVKAPAAGEQPDGERSPSEKLKEGQPLGDQTPGAQRKESEIKGEFNPNTE